MQISYAVFQRCTRFSFIFWSCMAFVAIQKRNKVINTFNSWLLILKTFKSVKQRDKN